MSSVAVTPPRELTEPQRKRLRGRIQSVTERVLKEESDNDSYPGGQTLTPKLASLGRVNPVIEEEDDDDSPSRLIDLLIAGIEIGVYGGQKYIRRLGAMSAVLDRQPEKQYRARAIQAGCDVLKAYLDAWGFPSHASELVSSLAAAFPSDVYVREVVLAALKAGLEAREYFGIRMIANNLAKELFDDTQLREAVLEGFLLALNICLDEQQFENAYIIAESLATAFPGDTQVRNAGVFAINTCLKVGEFYKASGIVWSLAEAFPDDAQFREAVLEGFLLVINTCLDEGKPYEASEIVSELAEAFPSDTQIFEVALRALNACLEVEDLMGITLIVESLLNTLPSDTQIFEVALRALNVCLEAEAEPFVFRIALSLAKAFPVEAQVREAVGGLLLPNGNSFRVGRLAEAFPGDTLVRKSVLVALKERMRPGHCVGVCWIAQSLTKSFPGDERVWEALAAALRAFLEVGEFNDASRIASGLWDQKVLAAPRSGPQVRELADVLQLVQAQWQRNLAASTPVTVTLTATEASEFQAWKDEAEEYQAWKAEKAKRDAERAGLASRADEGRA